MKLFLSLALIIVAAMPILAQNRTSEAAIRRVMDKQAEAWNRGDLDAFMSIGYWRSEKLTFLSGTKVTRGWQPTLDNYKKNYNSREKMGVLTFSDLEITMLGKNAAVVIGSWALKREKDDPHGKFTLTFRKFKVGWRIVIDHTS